MTQIKLVYLAIGIAITGVLIHLAAPLAGPEWFAFFHAPPQIVASARSGSWLAPVSSIIIAALMALCAFYAASVLGRVRRPPLQKTGLAAMAAVCLLRGGILIPLAFTHPELLNAFEIISAIIWFAAGLGLAAAWQISRSNKATK